MLNGERARLTKLLATEATTPTIPADPVVSFVADTLTAAPAADTLAPVPVTTAVAPVVSADADADADSDANNTASSKRKKSPSEIRRQRLRSRTVIERLIKKKQGDNLDN
ncbi:hypothetical protein GGI17_003614 [Coemansia sp. S146]|nr:hypothetical protein GGI17_003614 [Coemansia sp. S146]